jgi:hypothetical protein
VQIAANGSAGFEANGSLQKTEHFEKKDIGTTEERWESKTEFASAIGGAIKVTWTVIMQTRKKTRNYSDGVLLSTVITDWEPPAPNRYEPFETAECVCWCWYHCGLPIFSGYDEAERVVRPLAANPQIELRVREEARSRVATGLSDYQRKKSGFSVRHCT